MKSLKYKLLLMGLLFLFYSCNKNRDRFYDISPSERLETSIDKVYTVLQSNTNGWLMKYFPSATQSFGGYTIFARFTSSINVHLEGDFTYLNLPISRISTDPNSSYEIYSGAGPVLNFNTYNSAIHYFSMPGQFLNPSNEIGLIDGGYAGDNEFLVVKASSDTVVLEGRKTYNKIVMVPISNSESSTIVSLHRMATTKFNSLGNYHFEVDGENITASFVNIYTKRALRATGSNVIYAYRYTPNGLDFYKEYEFKGVKFKELNYVEPTGTYTKGYFTNDAGTIKLVPTT